MALRLIALLAALVAAAHASSIYYAYAGQSCGTPHTKCRNHLVCEHKVCKVRAGQGCIGRESLCAKDLLCIGKGSAKACVRGTAIGKGGNCNFHGAKCDAGLVCAGNKNNKVCVWPVGPGGWCASSFFPCRAGLFCQRKFCRTPVGADCKPKGSLCPHGAVCAGDKHKRRCVYPGNEGAECGAPHKVCATGLKCRNYRCASPRVQEGGDCTRKGALCANGLVCIGLSYQKKCVAPSGEAGPCATPFSQCQTGLACNAATQKCRDGRGRLGSRCTPNRPCIPSLACRAGGVPRRRTTCVQLRNAGESCGFEFLCKGSLKCKRGFCEY